MNAGQQRLPAVPVVGLVGAFMTAAYMTRCVYLTFFGEYRGGTRRSPRRRHARGGRRTRRARPRRGPGPDLQPTTSPTIACRCSRPTHMPRTVSRTRATRIITGPLWVLVVLRDLRRPAQRARHREVQRVVRAAASRSSSVNHADVQPIGWRSSRSSSRLLGVARRVPLLLEAPRAATASPSATRLAHAGKHVPRQEVLPRLPVQRRHRRVDQGSDRAAASTGSTSTSSTTS